MKFRRLLLSISLISWSLVATGLLVAQNAAAPSDNKSSQASSTPAAATDSSAQGQKSDDSNDALKHPLTEKQKKANSKALKQELSSTYKKWLNEDVVYIITPEEKSAFKAALERRRARPVH